MARKQTGSTSQVSCLRSREPIDSEPALCARNLPFCGRRFRAIHWPLLDLFPAENKYIALRSFSIVGTTRSIAVHMILASARNRQVSEAAYLTSYERTQAHRTFQTERRASQPGTAGHFDRETAVVTRGLAPFPRSIIALIIRAVGASRPHERWPLGSVREASSITMA